MTSRLTRRQVAQRLGITADSVSRRLGDRVGLGYCVIVRGGRGREMFFDGALLERWREAMDCRRGPGGRPCSECALILEDARNIERHLSRVRHGHGGCEGCRAPWLEKARIVHTSS